MCPTRGPASRRTSSSLAPRAAARVHARASREVAVVLVADERYGLVVAQQRLLELADLGGVELTRQARPPHTQGGRRPCGLSGHGSGWQNGGGGGGEPR